MTLEESEELETATEEQPDHGGWAHLSFGLAFEPGKVGRGAGGVDVALGVAYAWRRLRMGQEFRFTFLNGFVDTCDGWCTYGVDFGPLHSVVLYERDTFALSLGSRSLFSRAGTRRIERESEGEWVCRGNASTQEGGIFRSIPYRAFYGFSATADAMLEWRGYFLRLSYIRTRWLWDHGTSAPKHQDWVQVSFGWSGG